MKSLLLSFFLCFAISLFSASAGLLEQIHLQPVQSKSKLQKKKSRGFYSKKRNKFLRKQPKRPPTKQQR